MDAHDSSGPQKRKLVVALLSALLRGLGLRCKPYRNRKLPLELRSEGRLLNRMRRILYVREWFKRHMVKGEN